LARRLRAYLARGVRREMVEEYCLARLVELAELRQAELRQGA
jgi:hypothetical protein